MERVLSTGIRVIPNDPNQILTAGGSAFSVVSVNIGTETIDTFADTDGIGVVWSYALKKAANLRTGQVMAVWDVDTDTVEYAEASTPDIGDTSGVSFSVDINSDKVRLRCTVDSDGWSVSGLRTMF